MTSFSDPGDGSTCTLRQAIQAANTNAAVGTCAAGSAYPTVDAITFSTAVCPKGCTVTLKSSLPAITEDVSIGPSGRSESVTISGAGLESIFRVNGVGVTMSGLTLVNNSTNGGGGAISTSVAGGTLTLTDMTFSRNSGVQGGALSLFSATTVINRCTSDSNTAFAGGGEGGAIYQYRGVLIISNSTISNNTAYDGGGLITRDKSDAP